MCERRKRPEVTDSSRDLDGADNFGGRIGTIPVRGQASCSVIATKKGDESALEIRSKKDTHERVVKKSQTEESNNKQLLHHW